MPLLLKRDSMKPLRTIIKPAVITRLLICSVALLLASASRLSATELRATNANNLLVLSWSQDSAHEFYLQVSTNLADSTAWDNATNSASLIGTNYSVTTEMAGPQRFYRLKAWEVLFDGTSTASFRGYNQPAFPSKEWVVTAGGELKTVAGSPQGHIITLHQYGDFELKWDWKTAPGGNSGVLYRVTEYYDQPYKSAPEFQLLDDASYSVPANQVTGAVYGLMAPSNRLTVASGQWNQCRLLVQGNHVEHWLNGRRIAQYELNSPAFNALVAASPQFSPYASQFGKASTGFIAFQNWTPETWFRNIKVRSLSPE